MNIPDHPEIACALRTGYPQPPKEPIEIHCDECGCHIDGSEKVYAYDGERICEKCCRDRITEDFDVEEIAKALKIAFKSAEDYVEDDYE